MPRAARSWQWTDAACYHVINRGHARETVFHDDEDRSHFLRLLARYRDRFGLHLYHYCLMSNHFHLLLQLADARQLSRLVAGLLVSYWHHYRRRYRLVGHLFQGRFKSPAVEAEPYLLSCGRYIERNPLEAGLVALPWEYRWSSCRASALGEPDGLLSANPWYEALSPEAGRREQLWNRARHPRRPAADRAPRGPETAPFQRPASVLHGRSVAPNRSLPRKYGASSRSPGARPWRASRSGYDPTRRSGAQVRFRLFNSTSATRRRRHSADVGSLKAANWRSTARGI